MVTTLLLVPLNVTAVAPLRLPPLSVSRAPSAAGFGAMVLSSGVVTAKLTPLLVPPGVVMVTLPVVAPAGTVAVAVVALVTLNVAAAVPLKLTPVAPVKSVPVKVTGVPTGPLVGFRLVSVGAAVVVKDWLAP